MCLLSKLSAVPPHSDMKSIYAQWAVRKPSEGSAIRLFRKNTAPLLAIAQGVRGRPGAEGGVERLAAPTGLSSPRGIHISRVAQGQDRKDERDRSAIAEAMKWDRDRRAMGTDGSAVSSGGVARQWSTTRRKEKVTS